MFHPTIPTEFLVGKNLQKSLGQVYQVGFSGIQPHHLTRANIRYDGDIKEAKGKLVRYSLNAIRVTSQD